MTRRTFVAASPHFSQQNRAKIAAIAIAALLALEGIAAEELSPSFIAEHADARVSRVAYQGNRRTRDSAIAELTGIAVGTRLSDIDPEAARQRVLKSGIFSSVELSAEMEGGDAAVTVSVNEKWTLIPVPSASFGSDKWSVGLTVVEYNFLGLRKTLALSGSDSNLGWSGLVAYSDPRFFGSRMSFRAFADGRIASKEARYMDGDTYASYDETTADGGLSLQYPSEGTLNAELDLTLRGSSLGSEAAKLYGLYESSLALIPGLAVNLDTRTNNGYRSAGILANATYTHGFHIKGIPAYDSLDANAELDLRTFLDGFLELGLVGRTSTRPFQAQASLSGMGYRTLPQGYTFSRQHVAAYANLMIPFLKLGWSTMELGPFYEGGINQTGLSGDETDVFHGPGFGYRLYLRDISIPAIEIAASYNVPARNFVGSVTIGVSY